MCWRLCAPSVVIDFIEKRSRTVSCLISADRCKLDSRESRRDERKRNIFEGLSEKLILTKKYFSGEISCVLVRKLYGRTFVFMGKVFCSLDDFFNFISFFCIFSCSNFEGEFLIEHEKKIKFSSHLPLFLLLEKSIWWFSIHSHSDSSSDWVSSRNGGIA